MRPTTAHILNGCPTALTQVRPSGPLLTRPDSFKYVWRASKRAAGFKSVPNILYQEPMRAEGPKERPTTHSSSSTMCSDAESAKAAPTMAQVYIPTSWSIVIRLLYSNLWVLAKCLEFCGVPYMVLPYLASFFSITGCRVFLEPSPGNMRTRNWKPYVVRINAQKLPFLQYLIFAACVYISESKLY